MQGERPSIDINESFVAPEAGALSSDQNVGGAISHGAIVAHVL
jgi:hypothetical protein